MNDKPDVLIFLCDDMGYSDINCFGGFVDTPNLDRLAGEGTRYNNFYTFPRCAPSRSSLLTGLYPHQTGVGILTYNDGPLGYPGTLNDRCATMAEVLGTAGYRSYISGKWHLASNNRDENPNWPLHRGFDRHFGTLAGSGSYYNPHTLMRDNRNIEEEIVGRDFYYTDAISDNAAAHIDDHCRDHPDRPFFEYVAYTAPHWPLQAPAAAIEKYRGRFDEGWDVLRERKLRRMFEEGLIAAEWADTPRDSAIPPWDSLSEEERKWYARCMEVYAAQIDVMDQGIGRILDCLSKHGRLDNTLIFFLSDNGGCNEDIRAHPQPGADIVPYAWTREKIPIPVGNHRDIQPGGEDTFQTYTHWANLSNAPFRLYKSWVHEGGISTPFIVRWGDRLEKGAISKQLGLQVDIAATVYDAAGVSYPPALEGRSLLPLEGRSLFLPSDEDRLMFWEHQGNAAVRRGRWKAVCRYPGAWELYDLETDRGEEKNLAETCGKELEELVLRYYDWAERCGVLPRERILAIPGRKIVHNEYCDWMV